MLPSMRICSVIAVVATLGVSLVGCAKPSPVGKWKGSIAGMTGSTIDLTADQKIKISTTAMGPVTATGGYKVDGEKLNYEISSVTMNGAEVIGQLPPNIKSNLKQNLTWSLKDGNLELNGPNGPTTLTPIK